MFRLQDKVPEVYINESRDFQLICRLYDCVNSGVKFNIDSINNVFDYTKIKDRLLELMCTRVGFFPKAQIDSNSLRYIVANFPYILKYKGSLKGIESAVTIALKCANAEIDAIISSSNDIENAGIVDIALSEYIDTTVLDELMQYVLPAGYIYTVSKFSYSEPFKSELGINSNVLKVVTSNVNRLSQVLSKADVANRNWYEGTIISGGISKTNDVNATNIVKETIINGKD